MTAKVEIILEGAQGFSRGWDRISAAYGDDLRPFLNVIKTWWFAEQVTVFDTEGRAVGGKWEKLKPSYAAWKKKKVGNKPILQLYGHLKAAATGAPGKSWNKLKKKQLTIGINRAAVPYFAVHNFGFKPKNIPMRKYIATSKDAMRRLDKDVQTNMNEIDKKIQKDFNSGKDKKLR